MVVFVMKQFTKTILTMLIATVVINYVASIVFGNVAIGTVVSSIVKVVKN